MATPGPDSESEPVEPTEVWQQGKDAQFPAMVAIPAGRFEMGGRLPAELPRREVQLPAFSLSRHEVTVAQYRRYALDVGVKMPQIASDRDNMPVTGVNWHDAKGYAAWLAQRTGRAYRLPSEAEWEYAARAGTTTPYFGGTTLQGANCVGCDVEDHAEPKDVGSYQANDFGLFDTHGNVWEWVLDCWRDNYRNARSDGAAYERDNCERRVLRGGSWYNTAEFARSAYRGREVSGFRDGGVGFRVAHDGL
jgi:formylglycine-generating enzyme required for sulfatase activity